MQTDTNTDATPVETARREHLNLTDRTTWNDTPAVVLASLALAPRDEHGEVIGEGW